MNGIHKIGLTTTSVGERISSLSSVTAIPSKFVAERIFEIPENLLRRVESTSHKKLKIKNLHQGKEFFNCSITTCTEAVEDSILEICGSQFPDLVQAAKKRQLKAKQEEIEKLKLAEARERQLKERQRQLEEEAQKFNDYQSDRRFEFIMEKEASKDEDGWIGRMWEILGFFLFGGFAGMLGYAIGDIIGAIIFGLGTPVAISHFDKRYEEKEWEKAAALKYPYVLPGDPIPTINHSQSKPSQTERQENPRKTGSSHHEHIFACPSCSQRCRVLIETKKTQVKIQCPKCSMQFKRRIGTTTN